MNYNDKVPIIRVNDKKRFEETFNNAKPSKKLIESCEKAGRLFKLRDIHMNYEK